MLSRTLRALAIVTPFVAIAVIIMSSIELTNRFAAPGVAQGVKANIFTTFMTLLAGAVSFSLLYVFNRNRILLFFGINQKCSGVAIFLSRLQIKPAGTEGTTGENITVGFTGAAIIKLEYDAALLIYNELRPAYIVWLANRLSGWIGGTNVVLLAIEPDIRVSPFGTYFLTHNTENPENIIVVGSSVYNSVTRHYLHDERAQVEFVREMGSGERAVDIVPRRKDENKYIARRAIQGTSPTRYEREVGIIQRIRDSEHGHTIMICAGIGSSATFGSVRYLVENWRALQRQYGDSNFALCLLFPGVDSEESDAKKIPDPVVEYRSSSS